VPKAEERTRKEMRSWDENGKTGGDGRGGGDLRTQHREREELDKVTLDGEAPGGLDDTTRKRKRREHGAVRRRHEKRDLPLGKFDRKISATLEGPVFVKSGAFRKEKVEKGPPVQTPHEMTPTSQKDSQGNGPNAK